MVMMMMKKKKKKKKKERGRDDRRREERLDVGLQVLNLLHCLSHKATKNGALD